MAQTSTFARTVLSGPTLLLGSGSQQTGLADIEGADAQRQLAGAARKAEALGIDHLLVAQRWWGSGEEIEGSSYDAMAMTSFYAAVTERIGLITAVHPGFFLPAPTAKWGATVDRLSGGRWAINVTSGWNMAEFPMFGAEALEHDERYARSREFIEIMRAAWHGGPVTYRGDHYEVENLVVEPAPVSEDLVVYQGGQSNAARDMAASHSDWMFLNGGPPEKIAGIIDDVRDRAAKEGREVRFALYGIPLCRPGDGQAERELRDMVEAVDPAMAERRDLTTSGATGMWEASDDPLTKLDTNEGFATRLVGSPTTIIERLEEFVELGVDCFHLPLHDERFNNEVLPAIGAMERSFPSGPPTTAPPTAEPAPSAEQSSS